MSTTKNEHNPDILTPEQYGAPEWRLLNHGEPQQLGDEWWNDIKQCWEPNDESDVGFSYNHHAARRRITPPTDTTGSGREGETPGKPALLPFLVTVLSERHHIGSVTTGAQAAIIHARDPNSALGVGVKRYKDENPEAAISNTDVVPINMEAMPLVIELRAQLEALRRDGERMNWLEKNAVKELKIDSDGTEVQLDRWHRKYITSHSWTGPTLRAAIDSAQRQEKP